VFSSIMVLKGRQHFRHHNDGAVKEAEQTIDSMGSVSVDPSLSDNDKEEWEKISVRKEDNFRRKRKEGNLVDIFDSDALMDEQIVKVEQPVLDSARAEEIARSIPREVACSIRDIFQDEMVTVEEFVRTLDGVLLNNWMAPAYLHQFSYIRVQDLKNAVHTLYQDSLVLDDMFAEISAVGISQEDLSIGELTGELTDALHPTDNEYAPFHDTTFDLEPLMFSEFSGNAPSVFQQSAFSGSHVFNNSLEAPQTANPLPMPSTVSATPHTTPARGRRMLPLPRAPRKRRRQAQQQRDDGDGVSRSQARRKRRKDHKDEHVAVIKATKKVLLSPSASMFSGDALIQSIHQSMAIRLASMRPLVANVVHDSANQLHHQPPQPETLEQLRELIHDVIFRVSMKREELAQPGSKDTQAFRKLMCSVQELIHPDCYVCIGNGNHCRKCFIERIQQQLDREIFLAPRERNPWRCTVGTNIPKPTQAHSQLIIALLSKLKESRQPSGPSGKEVNLSAREVMKLFASVYKRDAPHFASLLVCW